MAALAALALTLCGCGGGDDGAPEAASAGTPSTPTTPAEVDVVTPDPTFTMPSRAEMESWEVILAEDAFLETVHADPPEDLTLFQDGALLTAGHRACDAMDRGSDTRRVLIEAVIDGMTTRDTTVAIAGAAAGTLCPEHISYLN